MANIYWVGSTGTWDTASTDNWASSSGGTGGTGTVPTAVDNVFFDSGSGTPGTVTMTGSLLCLNLTVSITGWAFATGTAPFLAISGNLALTSGTTWTSTGTTTFNGTTSQTITTGATVFACSFTFNNATGSWALQDDFNTGSANTVTLNRGTLDLNNYNLNIGRFVSTGTFARTLAFGTGQITLSGSGAVWNTTIATFTVTGSRVVNVTNPTATASSITCQNQNNTNSLTYNINAGTYALTTVINNGYNDLNFTGFSGSWASGIGGTIYGNLTLSSGMTLTSSTTALTFGATSGTKTIQTSNKTLNFDITFNGVGGMWQLQDSITMGSNRVITHTNGTLDLNGKTVTVSQSYTTAAGTKSITFNGGTLLCTRAISGAFNNAAPTGFTTTAGTANGTISMTAATAKSFVGGGSTYAATLDQGGAGQLTITGSNTFSNITASIATTSAASILFTAGTTTSLTTGFDVDGTAANAITVSSSTAAAHTLSLASGTVVANYLTLSYSTATGGATWLASKSTDSGNNTGWQFIQGTAVVAIGQGITIGGGVVFS